MSKPRQCPHCGHELPIDNGFAFDDKGNIICGKCNSVVLKVENAATDKIVFKNVKEIEEYCQCNL